MDCLIFHQHRGRERNNFLRAAYSLRPEPLQLYHQGLAGGLPIAGPTGELMGAGEAWPPRGFGPPMVAGRRRPGLGIGPGHGRCHGRHSTASGKGVLVDGPDPCPCHHHLCHSLCHRLRGPVTGPQPSSAPTWSLASHVWAQGLRSQVGPGGILPC